MCETFNAKELLQERRAVSEDKTIPFSDAVHRIKAIDELRFKHQAETGCLCWQTAIAEAQA
jgi:hypothetical protein